MKSCLSSCVSIGHVIAEIGITKINLPCVWFFFGKKWLLLDKVVFRLNGNVINIQMSLLVEELKTTLDGRKRMFFIDLLHEQAFHA